MNLFTDIDGVLLGKCPDTDRVKLANYAKEYLRFCIQHFECYWLTTHCRGSIGTVIDHLQPFADGELLSLVKEIKPTNFRTFKTEALFGDYIWVDDQPTAYEFMQLEEREQLHCWYQVNTRKDINELSSLIESLQKKLTTDVSTEI